jgi:hypothetical protein
MAPSSGQKTIDVPSLSTRTSKNPPTMGLLDAINLLLACIIGSGIFISAKAVLEFSGSYGLSIVVWIGCGLLCIMVKTYYLIDQRVVMYLFREHYVTQSLVVHMYHQAVIILIFVLHLVILWVFFVFGLKLHYLGQ